jgi:hypothetical protein
MPHRHGRLVTAAERGARSCYGNANNYPLSATSWSGTRHARGRCRRHALRVSRRSAASTLRCGTSMASGLHRCAAGDGITHEDLRPGLAERLGSFVVPPYERAHGILQICLPKASGGDEAAQRAHRSGRGAGGAAQLRPGVGRRHDDRLGDRGVGVTVPDSHVWLGHESEYVPLGAEADRTAGVFACRMLGTTLATMGLPPHAGRPGVVLEL